MYVEALGANGLEPTGPWVGEKHSVELAHGDMSMEMLTKVTCTFLAIFTKRT